MREKSNAVKVTIEQGKIKETFKNFMKTIIRFKLDFDKKFLRNEVYKEKENVKLY